MRSILNVVLACSMLAIGIIGGCKSFTDPDGTKHTVLTTQATQGVQTVQTTAATVAALAPPASGVQEVAYLITAIAGAVLGINEMRSKTSGQNLSTDLRSLTDALIKTGIVSQPPPIAPSSTPAATLVDSAHAQFLAASK